MADRPLIVAIDGPAGVGKSTVARLLAAALSVPYIDTGAIYRALGLLALRSGVDPGDRGKSEALAAAANVGANASPDGEFVVTLDGEVLDDEIRTPEVSAATSAIAVHPGVRTRMVSLQRRCAGHHGGVVEGRDIGTKVFPDADWKFFLDADPRIRAERRWSELRDRGADVELETVLAEQLERDRRDRERADSPLTADETYVLIDTGAGTAAEIAAGMRERIERGLS